MNYNSVYMLLEICMNTPVAIGDMLHNIIMLTNNVFM